MQVVNLGSSLFRVRRMLCDFAGDERGFAAAESVLLALLLTGMSVFIGAILQQAAIKAAGNLNRELAGSP